MRSEVTKRILADMKAQPAKVRFMRWLKLKIYGYFVVLGGELKIIFRIITK